MLKEFVGLVNVFVCEHVNDAKEMRFNVVFDSNDIV